ncbi:hypothetical protein V1511DRAFT_507451 [Dipodascopsis uninucleata]
MSSKVIQSYFSAVNGLLRYGNLHMQVAGRLIYSINKSGPQSSIYRYFSNDIILQRPEENLSKHEIRKKLIFSRFRWTWLYLLLLVLIGSQNINIMRQKHLYSEEERKLTRKIKALESVIEKIQNGEEVNIVEELGTGNPKEEQNWKDYINSLENKELVWRQRRLQENSSSSLPQTEDPSCSHLSKSSTHINSDSNEEKAISDIEENNSNPNPLSNKSVFL